MTDTLPPPVIPLIRADCTNMGLAVDASRDGGKTWQFVQMHRYTVRETPTVRAYSTAIDPARDREEYFAELDRRDAIERRPRDERHA